MSYDEPSDFPINKEYIVDSKKNEPRLFNQDELNDLVRDSSIVKGEGKRFGIQKTATESPKGRYKKFSH